MSIAPPDSSKRREIARKLFDAILSEVPIVGGPAAALLSVTLPSKGALDIDRWQKEITERVNDIASALRYIEGTIEISEDALALGEWLARNAPTAWVDTADFSEIQAAFPQAVTQELIEALGELELEGMVTSEGAIGARVTHVYLTTKLFEFFDPIVMGTNPRTDAATLAGRLIAEGDSTSIAALAKNLGWPPRRMNPAISIVGEFIREGGKSVIYGQPYCIDWVILTPAEKASLKRFVLQVQPDAAT